MIDFIDMQMSRVNREKGYSDERTKELQVRSIEALRMDGWSLEDSMELLYL